MKNWEDLRYFLAVARNGTVSGAAERLHVNQSTVSRRINKFEEDLRVRLFERLNVGYKLTNEGDLLFDFAQRIEEEMLSLESQLGGADEHLEGAIRVTVPTTLAVLLLTPIFSDFYDLYPDVELQVIGSNDLYNISQREADVAIRVSNQQPADHLIGRQLGEIQFGVFGHRRYLDAYHRDKPNQPLLWVGEDQHGLPEWLPSDSGHRFKLSARTNDPLITIEMIKRGLGVGRLPSIVTRMYPEFEAFEGGINISNKPVWLITHPGLRKSRRLTTFIEFVTDRIRESLSEP
jgi:DNA-binding transcriptional LysR family regulator